jgi:hypothetical protein
MPHLGSKSFGKLIVANRKVAKALSALHFSVVQSRKVNVSLFPTRGKEHAWVPLPVSGGLGMC